MEACRHGNIETVRLILSDSMSLKSKNNCNKRLDINEQGRKGDTPLHGIISTYMDDMYSHDVFSYLIEMANIDQVNKLGNAPLHLAILGNVDMKIFRDLITFGADLQLKNNDGMTPLDLIEKSENKVKYKEVIKASDVNVDL